MWQFYRKNMRKIIPIFGIIIVAIITGASLQLVHAWTEPTLTAPSGNLGAPINTSTTTQTKAGALYVTGGIITPLVWDTDNTLYYLNPFGASQVSSIFANGGINIQGNTSLAFSDHNGGFNMTDNTWIRATGVGNIYAPGEMQATNIRANSNLCIGSDCRTAWPAASSETLATVTARGASTATYSSLTGGMNTSILYDTNNTGYYVDPASTSQVSTIYANNWFRAQGDTGIYFQDHSSGLNMTDNTWIRAYGAGNIYAPGEMQATNIRANSTLCIGSDCRNSWAAGGLQLNTWQSNHYSGTDGAEYATIFYDTNNSGYYLNPNGMSNLERVDFSYGYDRNNTGYYIDLDNRTNLLNLTANGDIRSPIFYDQNNTGYYVDPNGSSRMNTLNYVDQAYIVDVRPQYMYDWNDSAYYIDMNNTSRFNYLGRNYGFNWTEYDWNNTAYYVDPNNVSIYNDLRANVFYDYSNTGYYMVPRATSRMNYGIYDNLYSYGWMQSPIFYDANNNGYYVDPASTSNFNVVTAVSFLYSSDQNLKKDLAPLENSLDKISQLQGVNFRWKDEERDQELNIGLVAQDVEKVYPELVSTDEKTGLKAVEYGNLVAPLIESIKEQQKQIEAQQKQIDDLRVELQKK